MRLLVLITLTLSGLSQMGYLVFPAVSSSNNQIHYYDKDQLPTGGELLVHPENSAIACIRHFGAQKKIFFVHFRNIQGTREKFVETFHDAGQIDMYEAMKAYHDIEGPMRPDHAPTMEGESNAEPGYAVMGRLFAVGYMRGLIEAIEKQVH